MGRAWHDMASGQGQKQLLHLLAIDAVEVTGLREALLEASRDDGKAGPVQCFADGRDLGDDRFAVAAFLDHAEDSAELALRAAQPLDDRVHLLGGKLHDSDLSFKTSAVVIIPGGVLEMSQGDASLTGWDVLLWASGALS